MSQFRQFTPRLRYGYWSTYGAIFAADNSRTPGSVPTVAFIGMVWNSPPGTAPGAI
ncbi:hypothetical protein RhoFasGS6_05153 [Rhodococcus fascians]|nr:hypothetical protein [Rhodococcus fascians]